MAKKTRKRGPKGTPWYRKFNDTWYAPKVNGQARAILDADGNPVKGRDNQEKAFALWHEIVVRDKSPLKGLDNPLTLIFEKFLDHAQRHHEQKTYKDYLKILQSFKDKWPDITVSELSQGHVEEWFDDHAAWSETTKWNYVTVVLAALNYAAKPRVKLIPSNPLKGMDKPRKKSRGGEAKISDETHNLLMERVPWDFRQVLMVLRHTGTRPSNICRVTAKNFNPEAGVWVFDHHNTEPGSAVHKTFKKTGRALVVPLTPEVVTLCKELAQKYPEGPLFRSRRGNAWRPNYLEKRFCRWRKILIAEGKEMPERIYSYCYRHQLATNLLENGESDTLVAALLGHKGTRVLHEHYSGVTAKSKPIRDLLERNVKTSAEEATVGAGRERKTPPAASGGAGENPAPSE